MYRIKTFFIYYYTVMLDYIIVIVCVLVVIWAIKSSIHSKSNDSSDKE